MISDIIRLSALYVIIRVFIEIAMPSSKLIVKYLFWVGIGLTIVTTIGPQISRMTEDIHNVSVAYTETKEGVEKVRSGIDTVTALPDKAENIPLVGIREATPLPPAQTFIEKITPFGAKKVFNYPVIGSIAKGFSDKNHGLDIDCNEGTKIKVARAGKVVAISQNDIYGNFIEVDHGGQWVTLYAHLNKITVRIGQELWGNEVIGLSGNTGNSTGPHLHFEVRKGNIAIDPKPYMK